MFSTVFSFLFPILAVTVAGFIAFRVMKKSGSVKRSFKFNFGTLGMMTLLFILFSFSVSAEPNSAATAAASGDAGMGMLAAAICIGLTSIGGGIALASGVPAAIGAVSENPKSFGKSLILVALGETLALYGVIIAVMILSKI